MNGREGFKAMNFTEKKKKKKASMKRRLGKKVLIFLGFSIGENPDKTRLTSSSFSDPSRFVFQDRFNQLFLLTYVVTKTYGCNSNLV